MVLCLCSVVLYLVFFFFFKQKTAYEMRISDWSSDVCSSDLVRRVNIGQNAGEPNLLEVLPPDEFTILPNTAGCYTSKDAVHTCQLARELLDGHSLVKLEVLGDAQTLYPDVPATLAAAETLVKDGFQEIGRAHV